MSEKHAYYYELMSRMLDGDLTEAETADLRGHVRACPDCARVLEAFSAAALTLREDDAEPPEGFSASVMTRIRAEAAAEALPAKEPECIEDMDIPAPVERVTRLWPSLVAAACLVLILGGVARTALFGRMGSSADSAAAQAESITMEAAAAEEPMAEAPPQAREPMPDTDGGMLNAAAPAPMPEEPAAQEAAELEEAAEDAAPAPMPSDTDDTTKTAAAGAGAAEDHAPADIDAPLSVPAGREADFEALLRDAGRTPGTGWEIVAYVEYRGVIYEFTSDGTSLSWRDAAEGMPALSPASLDELWAVLEIES